MNSPNTRPAFVADENDQLGDACQARARSGQRRGSVHGDLIVALHAPRGR